MCQTVQDSLNCSDFHSLVSNGFAELNQRFSELEGKVQKLLDILPRGSGDSDTIMRSVSSSGGAWSVSSSGRTLSSSEHE